MKSEVQSTVEVAEREVLQNTFEETFRDIFLDENESVEEGE